MATIDSVVFGVLALTFLAALVLAVPVAAGALTRWRTPFLAVAAPLAAGLVWLPLHAAGPDAYFTSGDVSRWEYASDNGRGPAIVVAGVLASVALLVVARAVATAPGSTWRRAGMVSALGGTFALLVAWVLLGAGH